MAVKKAVGGFLDFMGKMGLTLRGDPPRKIEITGREWGPAVEGVALSIREIPREDPEELASVSAVMRNTGQKEIPLVVPGWMHFYQIEVEAPLTKYGRALLRPERQTEKIEITLGPGDATETDLPVGSLYELRRPKEYTVRVSCTLPDGSVLHSNELIIRP
ncbi:MAG TPA: hypothetical protein VG273_13995 [Bryobacteraceae bacterium]|nr:hypothetical protein [Bryobacteraceae bacterium]